MENSTFAVIPSLGPIVPGHALLCPKTHLRSFSNVIRGAVADRVRLAEFQTLFKDLKQALGRVYGKPVHVFEHGSADAGDRILCTVEHAHLHFLPADVSILHRLRNSLNWRAMTPDINDLPDETGMSEYLYYLSPDGEALVCTRAHGFESQWMRRVFAEELGVPQRWNWRVEPNAPEADRCYRALAGL